MGNETSRLLQVARAGRVGSLGRLLLNLLRVLGVVGVLFLVQRSERGALLEEDVALDPPWRGLGELVLGELAGGHSEDVVELLEGLLLRLCDRTSASVTNSGQHVLGW